MRKELGARNRDKGRLPETILPMDASVCRADRFSTSFCAGPPIERLRNYNVSLAIDLGRSLFADALYIVLATLETSWIRSGIIGGEIGAMWIDERVCLQSRLKTLPRSRSCRANERRATEFFLLQINPTRPRTLKKSGG